MYVHMCMYLGEPFGLSEGPPLVSEASSPPSAVLSRLEVRQEPSPESRPGRKDRIAGLIDTQIDRDISLHICAHTIHIYIY